MSLPCHCVESTDAEVRAARKKLQKVLDALNPAGGKVHKP
jgi:hypothetical protein